MPSASASVTYRTSQGGRGQCRRASQAAVRASSLYADIANDTLPSVAFVKPDSAVDGHPGTAKVSLFEAFVFDLIACVKANPKLFAETAIVISEDESGGLYDSGFIQPLDFNGQHNGN
jgi:phospholipase C